MLVRARVYVLASDLPINIPSCFSVGGGTVRYLASGGADGLVALWELDDFVCVRTVECE